MSYRIHRTAIMRGTMWKNTSLSCRKIPPPYKYEVLSNILGVSDGRLECWFPCNLETGSSKRPSVTRLPVSVNLNSWIYYRYHTKPHFGTKMRLCISLFDISGGGPGLSNCFVPCKCETRYLAGFLKPDLYVRSQELSDSWDIILQRAF